MGNRAVAALSLAILIVAGASTGRAQAPDCRFFKVATAALNVFKEARASSDFIERLSQDDIVCTIGREQQVGDFVWTYVVYGLQGKGQRKTLDGWTIARFLKPAAPAEVAALQGPPEPARPPAPQPPPPAAPPPAASPPPAAQAPVQDVIKFSDPIPFGPYPVNGRSLEELITGVPMFSPIEGLDEAMWQKTCNNCHKWNRQSLCVQAGLYAKNPKTELRIPHPYGGAEKIAMMKWFQGGCQ